MLSLRRPRLFAVLLLTTWAIYIAPTQSARAHSVPAAQHTRQLGITTNQLGTLQVDAPRYDLDGRPVLEGEDWYEVTLTNGSATPHSIVIVGLGDEFPDPDSVLGPPFLSLIQDYLFGRSPGPAPGAEPAWWSSLRFPGSLTAANGSATGLARMLGGRYVIFSDTPRVYAQLAVTVLCREPGLTTETSTNAFLADSQQVDPSILDDGEDPCKPSVDPPVPTSVTVTISVTGLQVSGTLQPGLQYWKVVNNDDANHGLSVCRAPDGVTASNADSQFIPADQTLAGGPCPYLNGFAVNCSSRVIYYQLKMGNENVLRVELFQGMYALIDPGLPTIHTFIEVP